MPSGGYCADLRRPQRQTSRMKSAAEGDRHDPTAIPAHLDDSSLQSSDRERRGEPVRGAACMKDDIRLGARLLRGRKPAAQSRCDAFTASIDVDQLDLSAG